MSQRDLDAARFHRGLVKRMSQGDADALQAFHALHVERIYAIVLRIVLDPEDAREVVQDIFVKAWRQAGRYREDRGDVSAWLVLMARNTAIDHVRSTKRRREIMAQFADEPAPDPIVAGESVEQRDFVARTLGRLDRAQRRALELAFFGGCSQAEVAQHMEVPVSTVKNLLHRGLLRLREIARRHD